MRNQGKANLKRVGKLCDILLAPTQSPLLHRNSLKTAAQVSRMGPWSLIPEGAEHILFANHGTCVF